MSNDENYDGDSEPVEKKSGDLTTTGKGALVLHKMQASDDEWSSSTAEVSTAVTGTRSPRKTSSSSSSSSTAVAIKMSTLQASFAEKTAEEMKQIVHWYSTNKEEDRFTKVQQSRLYPDNPLACLDDDDDDDDNNEKFQDELTLPCSNQNSSHKSSGSATGASTPLPKSASASCHDNGGGLPDLASSPTSTNSPQSVPLSSTTIIPRKRRSSREAEEQYKEVNHLLEATQYMADIVMEYEHSSSASSEWELKRVAASKRRPRRRTTTTTPSYDSNGVRPSAETRPRASAANTTSSPLARRTRTRLDQSFKGSRWIRSWAAWVVALIALGTVRILSRTERRNQSSPPRTDSNNETNPALDLESTGNDGEAFVAVETSALADYDVDYSGGPGVVATRTVTMKDSYCWLPPNESIWEPDSCTVFGRGWPKDAISHDGTRSGNLRPDEEDAWGSMCMEVNGWNDLSGRLPALDFTQ